MEWIIFLFLTILTWGSYNVMFKGIEREINYFLALLIIAIAEFVIALPFVIHSSSVGNLTHTNKGLVLAGVAGVLLGLGTIFFLSTFKNHAPASIAVPAYAIGAMLMGVLGGIIIFKEPASAKVVTGFILGVVSIFLLTSK